MNDGNAIAVAASDPGIAASNRAALRAYLAEIFEHVDAYGGTNSFWAKIFYRIRDSRGTGAEPDALFAEIGAALSGKHLLQPISTAEFDLAWDRLLARRDTFLKEGLLTVRRDKTAAAALYLSGVGRLSEAREILRSIRLVPGYANLRQVHYARQVLDALPDGPLDILEIGPGGGILKIVLMHLLGGRVRSYSVVDIPEMLCMTIHNGLTFFPDEPVHIATGDFALNGRHHYVPADNIDAVIKSHDVFNVFLNTNSFQEMDDSVIAGYFDVIYSKAAPDALFYNSNWQMRDMARLDGSSYDNHPKNYPYRSEDRVVFWYDDPFQAYLRKYGIKGKLESRTSIRLINPTR